MKSVFTLMVTDLFSYIYHFHCILPLFLWCAPSSPAMSDLVFSSISSQKLDYKKALESDCDTSRLCSAFLHPREGGFNFPPRLGPGAFFQIQILKRERAVFPLSVPTESAFSYQTQLQAVTCKHPPCCHLVSSHGISFFHSVFPHSVSFCFEH